MAAIQHEFYRSSRGPGPADEDWWSLVFDPETRRLLVRHEWQASGHGGFDDWDVTEFLGADRRRANGPDRQPV